MAAPEANRQLARIFTDMARMYKFLGDKYRYKAYLKIANVMETLREDALDMARTGALKDVRWVGDSTIEKILEFSTKGKISKYEELKQEVPYELLELRNTKGFGPKLLGQIYNDLGLRTKEEVVAALKDGRIAQLHGCGPKKAAQLLMNLTQERMEQERMLLWDAQLLGETLLSWMRRLQEVRKVILAGSIRRCADTVGDFDLLVAAEERHWKKIVAHFSKATYTSEVLSEGDTRASIVLKGIDRQVDLRIVQEEEWGAALLYFTGSQAHNIRLRTMAAAQGFKVNEHGVFDTETGERVAAATEVEVYTALGMQVIPPEMREDRGELELAVEGKLPKLVELKDIRGDLQMHSTWSDGSNTPERIAKHIREHFSYDYIALTDHTVSLRIANGMDEGRILKQMEAIDAVNAELGEDFIKRGLEVNVLADGSLDVDDEILAQADWVVASIHLRINQDNTDRLIAACQNPYVNVIGHPTGRVIGKREGSSLRIEELAWAAKATGTALEINSSPKRMDLNDELAMIARELGVKLVISTDSHRLHEFDWMQMGVNIARRAWCTPADILNTGSWADVQKFVNAKRRNLKGAFSGR